MYTFFKKLIVQYLHDWKVSRWKQTQRQKLLEEILNSVREIRTVITSRQVTTMLRKVADMPAEEFKNAVDLDVFYQEHTSIRKLDGQSTNPATFLFDNLTKLKNLGITLCADELGRRMLADALQERLYVVDQDVVLNSNGEYATFSIFDECVKMSFKFYTRLNSHRVTDLAGKSESCSVMVSRSQAVKYSGH
jgi:hypothetical protein